MVFLELFLIIYIHMAEGLPKLTSKRAIAARQHMFISLWTFYCGDEEAPRSAWVGSVEN